MGSRFVFGTNIFFNGRLKQNQMKFIEIVLIIKFKNHISPTDNHVRKSGKPDESNENIIS